MNQVKEDLAENKINIADMINKSKGSIAYNIIDVEGTVDDELPVDEPPSPEAPPQDRTPELIG